VSPRPTFTSYAMPLSRGRQGPAAAISLAVHVAIAALVLGGAVLFESAAVAGPRPRRPVMTWVALPLRTSPQTKAPRPTRPPRAVKVSILAPPSTQPLTLSTKPPAVVGTFEAPSDDRGEGPSAGGDTHTAAGTAPGSDVGPGSESSAGDIFGPTPLLMPTAPPGAPLGDQRTREVRFSIRADGRVTRIEVIPPIKDSRYHRVFMKAMQDLAFSPVKTRDGRAIDYVYSIVVHP
jgi:hypothetical protein